MRVLVAPDCFAGTLSATEAAEAIATGWRRQAPADSLELCPLSDGGPGFLDALLANPGNFYMNVHTSQNPNGEIRGDLTPVSGQYVYYANELRGTRFTEPASAFACESGVGENDTSTRERLLIET